MKKNAIAYSFIHRLDSQSYAEFLNTAIFIGSQSCKFVAHMNFNGMLAYQKALEFQPVALNLWVVIFPPSPEYEPSPQ